MKIIILIFLSIPLLAFNSLSIPGCSGCAKHGTKTSTDTNIIDAIPGAWVTDDRKCEKDGATCDEKCHIKREFDVSINTVGYVGGPDSNNLEIDQSATATCPNVKMYDVENNSASTCLSQTTKTIFAWEGDCDVGAGGSAGNVVLKVRCTACILN